MKTSIVLGLGYGDEGKGATVNSLTNKPEKTLVIRFNGGQQAGHTVVEDGKRIVFSSFSSGTLRGADTYISEHCTFDPKLMDHDRYVIQRSGAETFTCFIHPMAMITTHWDVEHNRHYERMNSHGSVGLGVGATIARNTTTPHKLYAVDILNRDLLIWKFEKIRKYYGKEDMSENNKVLSEFLLAIDRINWHITTLENIKYNYEHIIFEGAQGIMLDMDFGYFPHVTRSNCTSKNAMEIIKTNNLPIPEIYYVMRTYSTRHGNGPMPGADTLNYPDKTNVKHTWQGEFRQGRHKQTELVYAVRCDEIFSGSDFSKKNIVITHLDQTNDFVLLYDKGAELVGNFLLKLGLPFNKVYIRDNEAGTHFHFKPSNDFISRYLFPLDNATGFRILRKKETSP